MNLTTEDLHMATAYGGLNLDTDNARIRLHTAEKRAMRHSQMFLGATFGIIIATTMIWTEMLT